MNDRVHVWDRYLTHLSNSLYIFSVLTSSLTHRRVSMRQGGFSSFFPAVSRTGIIWPSIFFIRRFYYTFMNRFSNIHAIKRKYACLLQLLGILLSKIAFNSGNSKFSASFSLGIEAKYSLRSIERATYCLTFKPHGFLIPQGIACFCFGREFTGESMNLTLK